MYRMEVVIKVTAIILLYFLLTGSSTMAGMVFLFFSITFIMSVTSVSLRISGLDLVSTDPDCPHSQTAGWPVNMRKYAWLPQFLGGGGRGGHR